MDVMMNHVLEVDEQGAMMLAALPPMSC